MGCAQGKTVEEDRSKNSHGFPACRKTINLEKLVDSLVAHDPQQVYLGARDELQLLDLKTDTISCYSQEHKGRINVLIKLKDGRLASGGQDKLIKVWDINSKESLMTLEGHKSMVWALNEVSGNKLISGGSDKRALIWDLNEKKLDFELYNDKEITVVLQLKTGKVLVCSENNLCLFDLDSKQKLTSIEVKSGIWCIRELADGSVAIGEGNGNIAILEVGNEISRFLETIPIYNIFLRHVNGINLYDSAELVCEIKDIKKFNTSNNLLAYAGMYPNAQNYNKNLHKLLLRISHKLVRYNPVYDFVYTNAYNKYSSLNTNEEHIEAMARRIVIKKFLQNLFTHWIKLED